MAWRTWQSVRTRYTISTWETLKNKNRLLINRNILQFYFFNFQNRRILNKLTGLINKCMYFVKLHVFCLRKSSLVNSKIHTWSPLGPKGPGGPGNPAGPGMPYNISFDRYIKT